METHDILKPGGPLSSIALREIAEWLDLLQRMALGYVELKTALVAHMGSEDPGEMDRINIAREALGEGASEIQADLRRWADEIESDTLVIAEVEYSD